MRSTLTIRGLYNFDNSIFEYFEVPEELNKEVAIYQIILNCLNFEILIPDADIIKEAIRYWTIVNLPKWKKAVYALSLEYNPIENYDRIEEWQDSGSGSSSSSSSDTGESKAKAFNSDTMVKNTENATGNTSQSNSQSHSGHVGHIHGNIGVTTSAAIQKEYLTEIAVLSVYDTIVSDFKNEFCLQIY